MRFLAAACLIIVGAPLLVRAQAFDGAPRTMSFQGVLTDAVGVPVADATYSVHFNLYDVAVAGSPLWQESQSVTTSGGVYSVVLGSVTPLDLAFDKQVWLGVKVESDPEMNPRTALTSVPYAFALRNLRIVDPETDVTGPNMVGGFSANSITEGSGNTISGGGDPVFGVNTISGPDYATIGGGSGNSIEGVSLYATISGGFSNHADAYAATVSGGWNNHATGTYSSVSGGSTNTASGYDASVSGGTVNIASGGGSTIPGGSSNAARGTFSFAAGDHARANHDGSFVWSDATTFNNNDTTFTTGDNQFLIKATGGVGIGTNAPQGQLHVKLNSSLGDPQLFIEEAESGDFGRIRIKNATNSDYWDIAAGSADNGQLNLYTPSGRGNVLSLNTTGDPLVAYNGAKLTDGGMWTNSSSRDLKTDFSDVDGRDILAEVAELPIRKWRYKVEPETVVHIGPMAQDFHEAFGLGEDSRTIGTVDADGVALVAIQALLERVEQLEREVRELRAKE